MLGKIINLAAILAMVGLVNATCQLGNSLTTPETDPETRTQLCIPQGSGSWTFALDTSEVAVPTFNAGAPWAGLAGTVAYIIYDNACIPKGVYAPSGNDCGTPYVIEENWLADVLTITEIDTDPAGARFTFDYGDGQFSIGNNGCTCGDLSSGLTAETGCKCAFPVDGLV